MSMKGSEHKLKKSKDKKRAAVSKDIMVNGILKLADKEEVDKGWVRISQDLRDGLPARCYAKLTIDKKTIFSEIRGTPGEWCIVKMNEYYRNKLDISDNADLIALKLRRVGLFGRLRALIDHPDEIVRNGISLGMFSVGFGSVALAIGLLDACVKYVSSQNHWIVGSAILGFTFASFFLLITAYAFWCGINALIRKEIT